MSFITKLFTKLKYFFLKLLPGKKGQAIKVFNTVNVGDVVYCLMPLDDHILRKIEKDHRIRPYVIIDKKDDHLIGFQCSTSYIPKGPKYYSHTLYASKYLKKRDSYIDLTKTCVIPYQNIRSYFETVSLDDQATINKKLDILAKKRGTDLRFDVKTVPCSGDVIEANGRTYYVHEIKVGRMVVIPTVNQRPRNYIYLKNGFYLDMKKVTTIRLDTPFEYVGMYGRAYHDAVSRRLEDSVLRPKHRFKTGTIMSDDKGNDVLVYLYTLNGIHQVVDLTAYFTGQVEKELTYLSTCNTLDGLTPNGTLVKEQLDQILQYLKENGYTLEV